MGSCDIQTHFISFIEISKEVKIKTDIVVELLYECIINNATTESSPNLDISSILELNELFILVNRYLSLFKKSLVNKTNKEIGVGNGSQRFVHLQGDKQKNVEVEVKQYYKIDLKDTTNTNSGTSKQNDDIKLTEETSNKPKIQEIEPLDLETISYSSEFVNACSTSGSVENEIKYNFTIQKKALLNMNEMYKVSIKHINNLNDFDVYVMNNSTKDFLVSWNAMVEFYKKHKMDRKYFIDNVHEIDGCEIFIAVWFNSLWCRGRILSGGTNNTFNVLLIDFGNRVQVNVVDCRYLRAKFNFPIVLQNVSLNIELTPERQTLFNALVGKVEDDLLFQMKCVGVTEDKYHVIMKEMNRFDIVINEIIKEMSNGGNEVTDNVDSSSNTFVEDLNSFDPMKEDFYSEVNDYKINSENACQAVMGYIPNDDRRYCKFGKSCRKKRCPRLHGEQDPNGWTKDKEEALTKTFEMSEVPFDQVTRIMVSHVVDIGEFYAVVEGQQNDEEETMNSLIEYMNQTANIRRMKKLRSHPAPGEIVIASYKDYFFRGKVLFYDENTNTCEIFFVDLGSINDVHLKDLRQMEPRYNHLPFQAYCFSVKRHLEYHIPEDSERHAPCLHLFRKLFLFRTLDCAIESGPAEPYGLFLFTKEKPDVVEYFNKCCKRILEVGGDAEMTSANSLGVKMRSTNNFKDVKCIPA